MPAETYANVGGTYRRVLTNLHVNVGGAWHNCNYVYAKQAGVWKTVFIRDLDPPPVSAPSAATGLNWTVLVTYPAHYDAVSGNFESHIDASYNGGAWQLAYNCPSPGAGGSFSDPITSKGVRGQTCQYRLVATDQLGNTGYSAGSNVYQSRPYGSTIIYPIESMTYGLSSGWHLFNGHWYVVGGAYGGEENYGFWFYDSAIRNYCKGWAPDLVTITMMKVSGLSGAGYAYIGPHDADGRPVGLPNVGFVQQGPYLQTDYVTYALDGGSWYPGFANGSYRGVAVVGNGQPFKAIYGHDEDVYSGALTFYFN